MLRSWALVLLISLEVQGRRRLGASESSVEERDFLDLAPVDEGGQHGGPAEETPGRREEEGVVKQEGKRGWTGEVMANIRQG